MRELADRLDGAALPLGALLRSHTRRTIRPSGFRTGRDASVSRRSRFHGRRSSARLVQAFTPPRGRPRRSIVVGDHGEGLGEHGEAEHGRLLYQATMHVPLVIVGPGVPAGTCRRGAGQHAPRLPHDPRLGRARRASTACAAYAADVVLGEAMKPVSRVRLAAAGDGGGRRVSRRSWRGASRPTSCTRIPARRTISDRASRCRPARARALDDYPVPSPDAARASGGARRRGEAAAGRARLRRAAPPRPSCARMRRARPT